MTEETFVRELERRADHVHGVPLSFDDVRGKARSIQRRRRAGAAAAVAAVVALAVVLPAVLGGHGERGIEPAPSPRGDTAVLHDGVVTRADGSRVDLEVDNADVTDVTVLTDGRVVVSLQQPYSIRVYRADGSLQEQYPVQLNMVTASADDSTAAWVAEDFTIRVLESGVTEPVERPGVPMPGEAVGLIDAVLDADHLLVGDGTTTSAVVTPDGAGSAGMPTDFPTDARVTDVSPDGRLWALSFIPRANQQYGCVGLFDLHTFTVVARSCDVSGLTFSPDGKHLLGGYYENNMIGDVTVVDLDLQPVGSVATDRGSVVSRMAWADPDHLLVGVAGLEDGRWSLQRFELDGRDPETVEGPVDGGNPEQVAEYQFSE